MVPERSIGSSFQDEPLSRFGFFADWKVEPRWNLCNAAGSDNGSKVEAVKAFLERAATAFSSAPTPASASPWNAGGRRSSTSA